MSRDQLKDALRGVAAALVAQKDAEIEQLQRELSTTQYALGQTKAQLKEAESKPVPAGILANMKSLAKLTENLKEDVEQAEARSKRLEAAVRKIRDITTRTASLANPNGLSTNQAIAEIQATLDQIKREREKPTPPPE